ATFGDKATFHDAAFGNGSDFAGANFSGSASFATSQEKKLRLEGVNFSNAIFTGTCAFDNRSFGSDVNFNGATFEDLAEFHGCEFHPGMSFHQTKFLKTKEDKLNTKKENDDATERLERSYRTLKLEMEKLRARNEEADFFALEMECRRQRGSVPRFERFAATVYKIFSDYGRSIARPLICLGFLVGYGFAYFYHLAQAKSFRAPGDVLRFTMEQIALPFSIWSNRHAPDPWVARYLKEDPWLLYAPATVMTLTAIGLLTLFLLALRRRFKMD
ncbi:MAG TPA: pentapeptide repeat-containing protein, partial [Alphaproteobacteria bacterium]|nr:pentapeptide repeat-containing protein [Alphaproteobacteria bacterium]